MKNEIATLIHDNIITNLKILKRIDYLTQEQIKTISGQIYRHMKQNEK